MENAIEVLCGDSLDFLQFVEDNSIDSIVTDPPYGLSFMGKSWDKVLPDKEIWKECFRVLKPGGYILAMSASRTYHRLAVDLEDIGFICHPMIGWVYGSGFPKATDCVNKGMDGKWSGWKYGLQSLKPALEPIFMGQKPHLKPMIKNIEEWGVGAVNIDACRVITGDILHGSGANQGGTIYSGEGSGYSKIRKGVPNIKTTAGRHPANLLHDGSEEVEREFLEQGGITTSSGGRTVKRSGKYQKGMISAPVKEWSNENPGLGDTGGVSRYFNSCPFLYTAKASKKERNKGLEEKGFNNFHPTVKPIKLMEWMVKLITPPNGTLLDPFMGSGSTGIAAKKNGFNFIGIEKEEEYFEIAEVRISDTEREDLIREDIF